METKLPALNINAFETPLMKTELERVASRLPMDNLSMKRYELPPPPAGKMTDVAAWNECVDNSLAQLEHQRTRIANLELMQEYGCDAWKIYNEVLQKLVNQLQVNSRYEQSQRSYTIYFFFFLLNRNDSKN